MAVLVANKVTKRFGGLQALSKIDLEVKENSIYSIIGPNGAGKSTTMKMIAGLIEGFISPSDLPLWVKLTVSIGTGIALYAYLLGVGREPATAASAGARPPTGIRLG